MGLRERMELREGAKALPKFMTLIISFRLVLSHWVERPSCSASRRLRRGNSQRGPSDKKIG
jgi:hypothetical protein